MLITGRYPRFSPGAGGTYVIKNGVALADHEGGGLGTGGPDHTTISTDGTQAFGYTNTLSSHDFALLEVDANGVRLVDSYPWGSFLSGGAIDEIQYSRGRIFTNQGTVHNLLTKQQVGTFQGSHYVIDEQLNRFFSITRSGSTNTIHIYDLDTLNQLDTIPLSGVPLFAGSLTRFGTDGLAFRAADDKIILIQSDKISGNPRRGVLRNDSDLEDDTLSALLVDNVQHGTLEFNADGTFSYTPEANFSGTDTFSYRASDGQLESELATVTTTVRAVNDPPVAVGEGYTLAEDGSLTVAAAEGLLANDTDVESPLSGLSAQLVTVPAHGTLTLHADGSFGYQPAADFFGTDTFTYLASDGNAASAPATVTIAVTPTPDAPRAADDAFEASEDTLLSVAAAVGLLTNDSDPDGDAITALLVSGPSHGVLTLEANGAFRYEPSGDFSGADSFTYRVSDGVLESAPATVTIQVAAVNDPPVAAADTYYVGWNLAVDAARGVLGNDTDVDSPAAGFSAQLVAGPSQGRLTFEGSGAFTYRPDATFDGSDTFTYYTSDGVALSEPATVTIAAALQVRIENVQIVSQPLDPVEGYFDVYVEVAPGFTFEASGYEAALRTPAGSGVTLVSAGMSSAAHPGLFDSEPIFSLLGSTLRVTDVLPEGAAPLPSGSGLFRVRFLVAPDTVGTVPLLFTPAFTNLADEAGDPLPLWDRTGGQIAISELPGPKVAEVLVRSEAWTPDFLSQLHPQGLGYAIPTGESQLADLPWINLNQIMVRFSEPVSVQQDDLMLRGVNGVTYATTRFTYDPDTFAAVWTLKDPVAADKLLVQLAGDGVDPIRNTAGSRLDGDWVDGASAFPSGDGRSGGDFYFRIDVLPGNVDQTGPTNVFDTIKTRNRQFSSIGDAAYTPLYDVDGSGKINILDTIQVRNRQFTSLPDGEPSAAKRLSRKARPSLALDVQVPAHSALDPRAVAELFGRLRSSGSGNWLPPRRSIDISRFLF